jgi:hypothetical protein
MVFENLIRHEHDHKVREAAQHGNQALVIMLLEECWASTAAASLGVGESGDHAWIVKLLSEHTEWLDVNWVLAGAAACGHEALVHFLLNKGAYIQWALGSAAAVRHDSPLVKSLLEKKQTMLLQPLPDHPYALVNDIEQAKREHMVYRRELGKAADDHVGNAWEVIQWALFGAAFINNVPRIRELLNRQEADVGWALAGATSGGHKDLMFELIDNHGAELSYALQAAAYTNNPDLIITLFQHYHVHDLGERVFSLAASSEKDNPASLKILLEALSCIPLAAQEKRQTYVLLEKLRYEAVLCRRSDIHHFIKTTLTNFQGGGGLHARSTEQIIHCQEQLEQSLNSILHFSGEEALKRLREEASVLAMHLGLESAFMKLGILIDESLASETKVR